MIADLSPLRVLLVTPGGHCGATAGQERRAPFPRESASGPTILGRASPPRVRARVLVCPRCAGPRRILGAVTEPHAVRRLLGALGLAAEPPPKTAPLAAMR